MPGSRKSLSRISESVELIKMVEFVLQPKSSLSGFGGEFPFRGTRLSLARARYLLEEVLEGAINERTLAADKQTSNLSLSERVKRVPVHPNGSLRNSAPVEESSAKPAPGNKAAMSDAPPKARVRELDASFSSRD